MSGERVLVPDDLAVEAIRLLEQAGMHPVVIPAYSAPAVISARAKADGVHGIIVRTDEITRDVMQSSPNLRVVSKHGVGLDNIDIEAATALGIPVMMTPGANAQSVAEHAVAQIYALAKRVVPTDARMRAGNWDKANYGGIELQGKCLGLVGCGRVGRRVALLMAPLQMRIVAYDPYVGAGDLPAGVEKTEDLDRLIREADVVSLHCPLTPETRGLIHASRLDSMKASAILVNTARGGIIDESALFAALSSGRIAGAGLDAYATEPPGAAYPFWSLPNVVASPHVAGNTAESTQRVALTAARNAVALIRGLAYDSEALVNPEVLTR